MLTASACCHTYNWWLYKNSSGDAERRIADHRGRCADPRRYRLHPPAGLGQLADHPARAGTVGVYRPVYRDSLCHPIAHDNDLSTLR